MTTDTVVYVVDDDAAVRDSLRLLLESDGLAVEAFDSAEAFLRGFQASRPCCAVLDAKLPGMSGLELHARLLAERRPIPVIFITGHGDARMRAQALRGGALDFLEKPFDNQQLLDRIHDGIARHARGDADDVAPPPPRR